jgi:hypothetical protein
VAILGEELADGTLVPPRLRPLPNSHVFALDDAEAARVLKTDGDIRLGVVASHGDVPIRIPSDKKDVLPRHTAILGTTGGGKSNTVAGLIRHAQAAGMAVILLDVEGEYSHLHEPADDPRLCTALAARGLEPAGVPAAHVTLYHLVGRDTANPEHPHCRPFGMQFAYLSPYAAKEILGLTEAQEERFLKAYDIAKELLRELGMFPQKEAGPEERARQERLAMELDDFERGYPRLTLSFLMDVVAACGVYAERPAGEGRRSRTKAVADEEPPDLPGVDPYTPALKTGAGLAALRRRIHTARVPGHPISWRTLLGRLGRLNRLKVFDSPRARSLAYKELLRPGAVSVIDLSDSGVSELNNLVIADLLRGVQQAQEKAYRDFDRAGARGATAAAPTRVLVIIEEAHEFLAADRIGRMPILFQQVARIAKRGRKRWLGLAFVTQLPQHLSRQVLSLCNNFVLHKLTDPEVIAALRHTVSGVDEALWARLPGLAPGQAIVSMSHLTRPLLVAVDPAPCKLRMMD